LPQTWARLIQAYELQRPFVNLTRDAHRIHEAVMKQMGDFRARPNFQIQALSNLFFRNKGAYVVGKVVNGYRQLPFAFSIFHNHQGQLYVDAILFGMDELASLFSFARSYFQVEMDVPSAYVRFLRSLMPDKPRSEIYTTLGLHKQGKALFYRDFLDHLRHSSDSFRISPGIRGMVMIVFDLPSYPYVFKVIKDFFPPQKDTSREQIQSKYRLVKRHDRVGRMADTAEYSEVAFPLDRFEPDLVEEIRQFAPSQLEISDRDGNGEFELILKHVYIERRMVPLNIYLQECFEAGAHDTKARPVSTQSSARSPSPQTLRRDSGRQR
jgi:isocitrate dehydrogenase kinase/phosphatase